jgi:hypothetical protein
MSRGQKRYAKVDGEVIFVDESGTPGISTGSIASSPYYADLLKTEYIATGERVYWPEK